jgi:serine/threonine protein phosphatase 1
MRTFVMGDLHGAFRAMKQVLEKVKFNYSEDRLIQIGDITDGWPDAVECGEELMKIKNLIAIRGNHDTWALDWLEKGYPDEWWHEYGGQTTMDSYHRHNKQHDNRHLKFFLNQKDYFVDEEKRLFVHAGYDPSELLILQPAWTFYSERKYWRMMQKVEAGKMELPEDVNGFSEIFIGHTQTIKDYTNELPVNIHHLWNVDQGCKSLGRLTLMNVQTKEFVQSDPVFILYSDFAG